MKRFTLPTICVLLLAFAGLLFYLHGRRYEIVITQKQIDDVLQAQFPVTKTHFVVFQMTYSNPRVRLLPDSNRIEIGLAAELNAKLGNEAKNLGGTILVTTSLVYRGETQQFFLSEPEINKLTLQGFPQERLDSVTQFATQAVREYIQKYPVYTLKATDAKFATAKLLLKNVEVRSTEIHVTLGL